MTCHCPVTAVSDMSSYHVTPQSLVSSCPHFRASLRQGSRHKSSHICLLPLKQIVPDNDSTCGSTSLFSERQKNIVRVSGNNTAPVIVLPQSN